MQHMLVEIVRRTEPAEYVRCETEAQADILIRMFSGRRNVRCVIVHEPRSVYYRIADIPGSKQ